MRNIKEFGFPGESSEQDEQNEREKISSVEELNGLIGTKIVEIRDYSGESAEDWIKNFKDGLSKIEILINSEDAAKILNKSVLEGAFMRVRTLMENLDNLDIDKLSIEVKDILLKSLNNLL